MRIRNRLWTAPAELMIHQTKSLKTRKEVDFSCHLSQLLWTRNAISKQKTKGKLRRKPSRQRMEGFVAFLEGYGQGKRSTRCRAQECDL